MYDEMVGKKGQNEIISMVDNYLKNLLSQGVKNYIFFSENCSSQNKNMALLQYFYTIFQSYAFGLESINHLYPEPRHSFLPCDRCFGLKEKKNVKLREYLYLRHIKTWCWKLAVINLM